MNKPPCIRIVISIQVVVQTSFLVVILALETQRVVDGFDVGEGQVAVGAVAGGPDDSAIGIGQLPGRAEMVQVVVVGAATGLGVVLFVQRQGPEAAGFEQVGAAAQAIGFRQQARAIVLKTGFALRGVFGDAPAQGVVAVFADSLRRFGADQAVVAIVLVAGDDVAGLAALFFGQVAGGVVVVVAVAHHQQAVAFDAAGFGAGAQQVAGRIVDEAFRAKAFATDQAGGGVVVVLAAALAQVVQFAEFSGRIVAVLATDQRRLAFAGDTLPQQAAQRIVVVVGVEWALAAADFPAQIVVAVAGKGLAVEFDAVQVALAETVVDAVPVRGFGVDAPAQQVVFVADDGAVLVFLVDLAQGVVAEQHQAVGIFG